MGHHLTDDILITPTLIRRFELEAIEEGGEEGRYFAIIQRDGGDFVSHNPVSWNIVPEQLVFARDMLTLLNRECGHAGAWVIVFTHPEVDQLAKVHAEYQRFAFIWLDSDGDPAFTLDWLNGESEELDFADVLLSGSEAWADKLETAWQQWKMLMRDVIDPAEGQTFKRAQGQKAASLH